MDLQYFAPGIFGADIRWRARPIRPLFDADVERVAVNRIGTFFGGQATSPETSSSDLETASSLPGTTKAKPTRRRPRAHVRRPSAQSSFRSGVGIAMPGDPIFLVVKFRRDGPWARGVVEG